MPFVGLGIHLVLALFFAVHAIKTGRQIYWLIILFSFPLLGSVVYFFAEFLPESRIERHVATAGAKIARKLDPGRELRDSRTAYEVTPTAENQMRLAKALLEAGQIDEAARNFSDCLAGPFGSEPDVRLNAARAELSRRNFAAAIQLLTSVRQGSPKYRAADVTVLLAQAYWANSDMAKAATTFAEATKLDGSVETRAEHAMFAIATGDFSMARSLQKDIDITVKTWNSYNKKLHRTVLANLDQAWSKSGEQRR